MAFTFDTTTAIGKVRSLNGDKYSAAPLLSDEEVTAILDTEGVDGNVLAAAALSLRAIANDQNLLLKKVVQLGRKIETDGPAVAAELRRNAQALEAMVRSQTAKRIYRTRSTANVANF